MFQQSGVNGRPGSTPILDFDPRLPWYEQPFKCFPRGMAPVKAKTVPIARFSEPAMDAEMSEPAVDAIAAPAPTDVLENGRDYRLKLNMKSQSGDPLPSSISVVTMSGKPCYRVAFREEGSSGGGRSSNFKVSLCQSNRHGGVGRDVHFAAIHISRVLNLSERIALTENVVSKFGVDIKLYELNGADEMEKKEGFYFLVNSSAESAVKS